MTMGRDWRSELVEAFWDLFHAPAAAPECAQGYPQCGEGWHGLLDRACVRIGAALAEGDTFQPVQIKQKLGTLRFYWRGSLSDETKAKVQEAIDLAEARSACTCEVCGEEGRLYRSGGVLMTRCEGHAEGQPVAVKPGFANVHLLRRTPGTSEVYYARYDRETDAFAEVRPFARGTEL
jgi:hypothetical protein